jgi:transcriptional antiterminator RfaH
MQRCDVAGKLLPADALCVGDSVEVLEGPFTKFVATVEAIDAQQRVWVLMELMGQGTKVQLAPEQIKLVD